MRLLGARRRVSGSLTVQQGASAGRRAQPRLPLGAHGRIGANLAVWACAPSCACIAKLAGEREGRSRPDAPSRYPDTAPAAPRGGCRRRPRRFNEHGLRHASSIQARVAVPSLVVSLPGARHTGTAGRDPGPPPASLMRLVRSCGRPPDVRTAGRGCGPPCRCPKNASSPDGATADLSWRLYRPDTVPVCHSRCWRVVPYGPRT